MARTRAPKPTRSVRIIGGQWRGRRLAVADAADLRPTSDRVRETLFNWLAGVIQGASCLDLYAGTGVLGLEALSRGAAHAVFVERNPELVARLCEAARTLAAQCTIKHSSAEQFLAQSAQRFDVVFVDPPYDTDPGPVCAALAEHVNPGGLVYVERGSAAELEALQSNGRLTKRSRAGSVHFGLLQPLVDR